MMKALRNILASTLLLFAGFTWAEPLSQPPSFEDAVAAFVQSIQGQSGTDFISTLSDLGADTAKLPKEISQSMIKKANYTMMSDKRAKINVEVNPRCMLQIELCLIDNLKQYTLEEMLSHLKEIMAVCAINTKSCNTVTIEKKR